MSSFWSRAVTAAAALACVGTVSADVRMFNNIDDFAALSEASGGFPSQRFRSSGIVAPVFQINSYNPQEVDDAPYIFLGTIYGEMQGGPMILDARDLSLVYADPQYENTYCSSVEKIGDTPYLAFWEGFHSRGHANGYCLIFDQNYNLKYNLTAQGLHGALADMHEMSFSSEGTVVFSTYFNIPYDCTSVGGPPDALLMDSGFQEVDPDTNEVLFDWKASEHFDVADSYANYGAAYGVAEGSGWDFFHINSIEKTNDGNFLISSRHLSMLSLINGTDGSPIWVLGGKKNQFTDLSEGNATNFGWQHDARFYKDQSQITMFDNHGEHSGPCKESGCLTRGLHLEIDTNAMTAEVVQSYYHPEKINSGAMGGFQSLENGNAMVGWGYNPGFVEYKPDGTPVLDAQRGMIGNGFLADMFAYRVNKHHWTGRPNWKPSIAVDHPHDTTKEAKAFVSWNGATEVASWAILACDDPLVINDPKNIIAESARTGFETEIYLGNETEYRFLAAAAIDSSREVLSSTVIIDMRTGEPFLMQSHITSVQPSYEAGESDEDVDAPKEDAESGEKGSDEGSKDGDDTYTMSVSNVGVMGAGLLFFGFVSYFAVRFWRRRRRSHMSEQEKGTYRKVDMEG